jgi:putative MATE family efflux protein
MIESINTKSEQKAAIMKISVPFVISGLLQQTQILVDRAFLGNINSNFFSAIGNVFYPYTITLAIIWSITTGTTVLVSQKIGARQLNDATLHSASSLKYNSILSIILFFIWFFFAESIFKFLGVQEPILSYCIRFIRFLCFSLLILGVDTTSASILQSTGITKPILYAGILRNVLNVILDWILIFGNLGFPRMEIEGAALATSISNFVSGIYLLTYLILNKKTKLKLNLKNVITAKLKYYTKVIKIGIPASLEELLWNFGALVLIYFLNKIDSLATGIYTLILGVELFPLQICFSISKATIVLVGRKTGERDIRNAIKITMLTLKYAFIVCIIFALIYILLANHVLSIFTQDSAMIDRSIPFLIIVSIMMFFKALNMIMGSGIRGYGDTKWMLFTQIGGTIFTIATSYLLVFVLKLSLYGIFFTLLADEFIRSGVNTLRFMWGKEITFKKNQFSQQME